MTPTQKQTVAAILGADLTTLASDRLIELCILHRANPEALPTFPAALKAELERRFTDGEIRKDDSIFAVLETFSAQFQKPLSLFVFKLREMAASINRDIWFTDNRELFKSALDDAETAAWIAQDSDTLTKILHNKIALPMVAQSETAATAILTRTESLALWKNTPSLWAEWTKHQAGMTVLAKSAELVQYAIDTDWGAVIASSTAMAAVIASSTAMAAVIASSTAMAAVAASSTAMAAVIASSTAMAAVAASSTAMAAVAASSTAMAAVAAKEPALRAIVNQKTARDALIANNDKFQAVREVMYNTVKTTFKRTLDQAFTEGNSGVRYHSINANLASPDNVLIFSCLGSYSNSYPNGRFVVEHANGSTAATGTSRPAGPATMQRVDVVSFAGAKFKQIADYAGAYVEVYVPQ